MIDLKASLLRSLLSYTISCLNIIYREGIAMTKRRRFDRFRNSLFSRSLLSAGWAILVVLVIVLIFAYVLTRIDVPESVVSVITAAALCIGAYVGGYVGAKKNRRNGLLLGILCGAIIFIILFLMSIIFAKSTEGLSGGAKLFLVMLCGSVGGIVGVNSKNTRY